MSKHSPWEVKVKLITHNLFRTLFDSSYIEKCGYFLDQGLVKIVNAFSNWVDYIPGETILKKHSDRVCCAIVSNDGRYLFTGSKDTFIIVWDLQPSSSLSSSSVSSSKETNDHNTEVLVQWRAHNDAVFSLDYHPSGVLVSGSYDTSVRIWDANRDFQLKHDLKGHTDWVFSVAINDRGTYVASGSFDKTVRIWDSDEGYCLGVFREHSTLVLSVLFFTDDRGSVKLLSGSPNRLVRMWDISNIQDPSKMKESCMKVTMMSESVGINMSDMKINCDGSLLVCVYYDGLVVYSLPHMEEVHRLIQVRTLTAAFHPRCPHILALSAGYSHRICIYSIRDEVMIDNFDGHMERINCLCFTPDGCRLVSTSHDKTARVWDTSQLSTL